MQKAGYSSIPSTTAFEDDFNYNEQDDSDEGEEKINIPLTNLSVKIPVVGKSETSGSPISSLQTTTSAILFSGNSSSDGNTFLDSISQGRLIKLVGIPPEPALAGDENGNSAVDSEQDSPCLKDVRDVELPLRPPMIAMGFDEKGRPIVDVIDSMDEDPFTLDSFERMIRAHALKGKDFLIARVATVDPQDDKRFYYSYYSAHHINKVLFRTQPEEGLLHRMKAKNPLNNMVIMGDVHYYAIKAMSVNIALMTNKNSSPLSVISSNHAPDLEETGAAWKKEAEYAANILLTKINRFLQMTGIPGAAAHSRNHSSRKLRLIMRREGLIENTAEEQEETRALIYQDSSSNRGHYPFEVGENAFEGESLFESAGDTILAHVDKFKAFLKTMDSEPSDATDYCCEFEILKEKYQQEMKGKSLTKRKVRSSSFLNDFGRTNGVLTFEQWLKTFEVSPVSSNVNLSVSPPSCSSSSKKLKLRKQQKQQQQQHVEPNATKIKIDPSPVEFHSGKLFYIAEYLASDDDFLMKSCIRTIFKENALESDDAVLFTLPSSNSNSSDGAGGEIASGHGEQHPALRNFIYAVESENG
ncbi:hypothetical protein HK100_009007, partial [Physocladia obscura]